MSNVADPRTLSNVWYGSLSEGVREDTPEAFRRFLEAEVLGTTPAETRPKLLKDLRLWVPEHKATIDDVEATMGLPRGAEGGR